MSQPAASDYYTDDLGRKLAIWLSDSKFWTNVHWLTGTASVSLSALSAARILAERCGPASADR